MTILTLTIIAMVSPYFLIVFIPILLVYYTTQAYYRVSSRELKRLDAILRSPLYAHFSETLTGLSTIRAYRAQPRFITVHERRLDMNNQAYYTQLSSQRWLCMWSYISSFP